jgi:hypothetical protein
MTVKFLAFGIKENLGRDGPNTEFFSLVRGFPYIDKNNIGSTFIFFFSSSRIGAIILQGMHSVAPRSIMVTRPEVKPMDTGLAADPFMPGAMDVIGGCIIL